NATEMTGNTTVVSEYASTVPGAPTDLTLTPTSLTSMIISWAAPTSNGGAPVTSYVPVITPAATCGAVTVDNTTGAAWCEVTSMAYSTAYSVSVSAANRMGTGTDALGAHTTSADPTPPPSPDNGSGSNGSGSSGSGGSSANSGSSSAGGGSAKPPTRRGARLFSIGRVYRSNQARTATLTTRVRVTGPGRLTQIGRALVPSTQRMSARGGWQAAPRLGAVLCSTSRSAPRAGTYTVRCVLNRSAARQLTTRSIRARITTTFRARDGRVTARSTTVILRRTPQGRTAVTG
ncbi:MAG: fibronectin type III domain-containing protein, partial [Miltoncostaeaceae bacterium]